MLPTTIEEKWKDKNFQAMTPVQSGMYERIKSQKDAVVISPTGTGKTLAYILPLLEIFQPLNSLQGLVLVPSQELAQQIVQVWREWSDLCVLSVTGGANLKRQLDNLKKKPDVIVATPGRLNEIAKQSKKIKFHQLKAIILDEADYLLQAEHLANIREIVKRAPSKRQLLFFSATENEALQQVGRWFNTDAEVYRFMQDKPAITHGYLQVDERKRVEMLRKLAQVKAMRALVFVQNIAELAIIYEKLAFHSIPVARLHGDMLQTDRKKAIDALRKGEITFLLTTDVASRGMDIDQLDMIIHYHLPWEKDIYTHRSGRTGRMGQQGLSLALVDRRHLATYQQLLKDETIIELDIYASQIVKK